MEMEYLRRLGNAMKSNEQPTLYNVATTTPNSNAKFRTQQKKKRCFLPINIFRTVSLNQEN